MSPAVPKNAPIRLTGDKLAALRAQCFERAGYRCEHILFPDAPTRRRCGNPVVWESGFPNSGHMHHIKSRGAGGSDELSNVKVCCADCHLGRIHTKGEK